MHNVILGTKIVEEFKELKAYLEQRAKAYYVEHKKAFEHWNEGEIAKIWIDSNENICIEYESGNWWHYNEKGEWW